MKGSKKAVEGQGKAASHGHGTGCVLMSHTPESATPPVQHGRMSNASAARWESDCPQEAENWRRSMVRGVYGRGCQICRLLGAR